MPLISVLMPVYNARQYLGAALASIIRQTVADAELIIVDDGSTDGSLLALQRFAAQDSRVRLISRPNTGIVGALNDGLAVAKGRYIARMDADDLCDPRRFELQVERLEREPALVALGSCAMAIDPEGAILGPAPVPLTHEEIEAMHLRGVSCIYHPAVMMRAEALRRVEGYRGGMCPCEDYDLWLRLGEVGRLANLPQPLFTWRRTATGIVATKTVVMQATVRRVLEEAWVRRGLPGQPVVPEVPVGKTADLYQQWGWMALKSGYARTARTYARRSVATSPWRLSSWRLAYCALRGW